MNENKICVYAIAKNESKFVEEWVKSMSPADHIIVLDTGSTDNTVELLRSFGVEVHEISYDHFRFDTARNDSLDLVPDEYNIRVCTDLDEKFESDDWAQILKDNWDEEKGRVIYSYVWNHTETGQPGLQFTINKIHGKNPDLRWAGAVHEHLTFMSTGKREFSDFIDLTGKIVLHHYPDLSKDRRYYIRLAEERIKDNPDDIQAHILLGNEYKVKGWPEKAVKAYTECLEKGQDNMDSIQKAALYYNLGSTYMQLNQALNAMKAYTEGIAARTTYRDNYYGLGVLYINSNLFDAAIGMLEQGLKGCKQEFFWMEDPFTWTYALWDALGFAYFAKGNIEKAMSCASIALSYEPNNQKLVENYQKYLNALKQNN